MILFCSVCVIEESVILVFIKSIDLVCVVVEGEISVLK